MEYIKEKTIGKAWLKIAKLVMDKGYDFHDENVKLKEMLDIFVEIEKPLVVDEIIKKYGDGYMIEQLRTVLLDTRPGEWGWSYGQRLFGDSKYPNQVEFIIKRLKRKPETKAATITCLFPQEDFQKGAHIPCISLLDFKIRDNQLNMTACLRSQDVGKKMYGDAIALGELMKRVAEKLNITVGSLKLFIMSAHIYEKEFDKIREIIKPS